MASQQLTDSLRETLSHFAAGGAPMSTPEVAETLDLGRRSTYERLERLAERDLLETKKVGASARVWWRPADETTAADDDPPQFESLVDAVEEYAIFCLDAEGHIETWNPGARRIKGYEADEIVGEHFSAFYSDADVADGVPERNLERAAADGEVTDEGWRVRADGTQFWASVTITAIRNDAGELQGFAKVTRDMTERRQRKARLREEVSFTESILENQRDLLYAFDASGMPVRWNDNVVDTLGYDEGAIADMHATDFVAEEATNRVVTALERVLTDGESLTLELPLETADGEQIPYEVTATPIVGADGDTTGFTGIGRDITERKAREDRLERQRDELAAELDDVFTRIDDGFFALDDDWRFVHVNDRAAEVLDESAERLVGQDIWAAFPAAADSTFQDEYERAMTTQESVTFEAYFQPLSTWFQVNAYPSETGLSVYFRDVSARKERERDLELYETLFEESRDVNAVLDVDGTFEYVTPSASNVLGYEPAELIGENGFEFIHEEDREYALEEFGAMVEQPGYEPTVEFRFERADGSWAVMEARVRNLLDEPDIEGMVVYTREVTERRERERDLELYETIVSAINDGVYVLDEEFTFRKVNEAYEEMTGYDREQLLGEHASFIVDEAVSNESAERLEQILAGELDSATIEADIDRADGKTLRAESNFTGISRPETDEHRKVGVVRDVSERVERERKLERRVRQQQVVADLGQDALETRDIDGLMAEAADLVADVLDNDYCKVLDLDADAEDLLLRQGVGWADGIVGSATVSSVEDDSQAAYTLRSREPVVVTNLETETRFSGPDLLRDHEVKSGISTIIGPYDDPWGIFGTHDTEGKEYSEHDVRFVQSVATILATAIERHRHEHQLVHQRERLAALNGLNEVVRDITDAVVEQSTREEIENVVCAGLAGADSFSFAWIGEADSASRTVELRTEAGVSGYLDDVTISIDSDEEHGQGPTGRAFRTGEVQVSQNVQADEDYEPWQAHAAEHGVRSSAAIPIVHEDSVYGVLNVYADRPNAFTGEERAVIAQLGEVVGHAIAAVERKRALMSDEVVELEFQLPNVFDAVGIDADPDGWFSLDEAVPTGEDDYLLYGQATCPAGDVLSALVDELPHWKRYEIIAERDGHTRFEAHLSEPPILSAIASRGGHVEEARIDANGDYSMRIHLPPSIAVRSITEIVTEHFPTAELIAQRQLSNPRGSTTSVEHLFREELTDRQRTVLTAAYHAGFFEWPRENNGEHVADSLGVSSPTFHQHLRKAEGKVFESLLGTPDGE